MVYWDDGTWSQLDQDGHWCSAYGGYSYNFPPRPLEQGEMWITEAVAQFRQLVAGKRTGFSIRFADGSMFAGKLRPARANRETAAGDYCGTVHFLHGKPRTGWIRSFKPTPEVPDVQTHIINLAAAQGKKVTRIEITERITARGQEKWAGVFFHRKPE
jgi:hypothetical protein